MGLYLDETNIQSILGDGTYAMCYGKPWWLYRVVDGSTGRYIYKLSPLGQTTKTTNQVVDFKEPSLSFSSVRFGFVNVAPHAHYLLPIQGRTVGVTGSKIVWTSDVSRQRYGSSYDYDDEDVGIYQFTGAESHYSSEHMRKCIVGEHPTYNEAVAAMEDNKMRAIAFHRDYCITRRRFGDLYSLMYKTRVIGSVDPDTGKFAVDRSPISKIFVKKLKELANAEAE